MAYNTKPIIRDKDGNPISQYYNKELDQYEPVMGAGGGNAVVLYNADGTENNSLSLIPILEKLSQLTGTVIDEETRKSNELQRIEFYNQLQKMLADGELKGDKGDTGLGLQFDWQGTSLGVRVEGDTGYIYVDLRGPKGDKGETGSIDNLTNQHIVDALGYAPADESNVGDIANLQTDNKTDLVNAVNEVKSQSNQMASEKVDKSSIIQTTEVNDSTRIPSSAVTYALHQELKGISVQDISSAIETIGVSNATKEAFKVGKICFITVTGKATDSIGAYTPISKLNGYTAKISTYFANINNKSYVMYGLSNSISTRVAIPKDEDVTFSAFILLN